jgi:hypothetical protein
MTELEIAQRKLEMTRAQRCWAGRRNDVELEQFLAKESHKCWVEVQTLSKS